MCCSLRSFFEYRRFAGSGPTEIDDCSLCMVKYAVCWNHCVSVLVCAPVFDSFASAGGSVCRCTVYTRSSINRTPTTSMCGSLQ